MADGGTAQTGPDRPPPSTADSGGVSPPGEPPESGRSRCRASLSHRVVRGLRVSLLAYGVVLGCVGVVDVFRGNDFDVRTDGAGLAVAAVAVAGGSLVALNSAAQPGALRRGAPVVADIVALVTTGWVVFRVQSNFTLQPVLTLTAGVTVLAGLVALVLLVVDASDSREGLPDPVPAGVAPATRSSGEATIKAAVVGAVAALLAAGVTLPQFWYSARYEPSTSQPVVAVENEITEVQVRENRLELTAEITLENTGRTPIRMVTSLYEITGTRIHMARTPLSHEDLPFDRVFAGNYGSAARLSTYATYSSPQQIQVGPVGEDYAWIGPGEKLHTTLQAHAPRGSFDLLRMTTDVAVARADRVETVADDTTLSPGGREASSCAGTLIAESRRPLAHVGLFDRLTESDRELVTFWALSGDSGDESPWWPAFPWTSVSIQHAGHGCAHALAPDHDGLEDNAMVGWASSVTEAATPEEPSSSSAKSD